MARPTPAGLDERSLRAFVAAVAERTTGPVRAAYLDHGEPSIHSALDEVAAAGVDDVLLVPLAVPADRYLVTWMAKAVANWRATRSHRVEIRISDGLTTLPAVADAVAALSTAEGRPIAASPAGFRSPAWSVLEIPERHLLVRRGPRCTVYGAGATYRALAEATRGTSTQVTPTGCVGPCNLGPLVIDHPDGAWHQHVDPDRAGRLASQVPQPHDRTVDEATAQSQSSPPPVR
ncbi:MAG TPA: CbiX/SirB N-terminal domain-containing protein [Pseudonocardia sp.]|uniref:(2Fe-2S) ferredoxin domain-containing protein n=1 Tax=Pseudonocardia sp. TaxID=60912 RepID=UPI002B4B57DC|nr:CbiX/SirB N-terminal domain-containing protein [Pseudonocardia sp.]HLU55242.1 CbiX/SirB N-terminal domain-containing protein [Pseudonocardia sp.]